MKKTKAKILIVDDNEEILIALKLFLSEYFETIITEKTPNRISNLIENNYFDVVILDMNFSMGQSTGNEGIFWMNKILEFDKNAVIIFITAYGDIELSVKAIKMGATDFIQKPWNDEKLLTTIFSAIKLRKSKIEIHNLRDKQTHLKNDIEKQYSLIGGKSIAMQKVFEAIDKVASTEANVLILGENGTGKELVAREIHKKSKRADEVFVKVDMSALSESLFESEMFGHKMGSYTDAKQDRAGRFEIANKGSLFLDEIGNLPAAIQSKLLSVLQNREITRIGSNSPIPVDIRLITATNKPLYEMIESNIFRDDLLYRINTIQIEVPPLRERTEDIPVLLDHFLKIFSEKYKKQDLKSSNKIIEKLCRHSWPGNVRELQHLVEKAVILCDERVLQPSDFFFYGINIQNTSSLNLQENEKAIIQKAISKHKGNLTYASNELGITRKTLYNKIKKYGL